MPNFEKDEHFSLPAVAHGGAPISSPELDEKLKDEKRELGNDEIVPADQDIATINGTLNGDVSDEQRAKIRAYYGHKAEDEGIAPSDDVEVILDAVIGMSEDEALDILFKAIEDHRLDNNFP